MCMYNRIILFTADFSQQNGHRMKQERKIIKDQAGEASSS